MLRWTKWLYPGLRVKRWILLMALGIAIICLGVALALDVNTRLFRPVVNTAFRLTHHSVPPLPAGVALCIIGLAVVFVGLRETVRSIAAALRPHDKDRIVEVVLQERQREAGLRLVAIGGGTGLPNLLRGAKRHTSNITAIVNIVDDGGSSGRLRDAGFPPPGDIRNCLVALSEVEPLMTRLFQYRFHGDDNGLSGHSFGNLLLAAMTDITGDFDAAIRETSKVLAIRGQVLPATLEDVVLCARLENGDVISGQTAVNQCPTAIRDAFLKPEAPVALPEAVSAIEAADVVVIGPGSLYSSLLPNLLVPGVREAIHRSSAIKIYACNVMTQPHETDGYSAADHVGSLLRHAGPGIVDFVLVNLRRPSPAALERYRESGALFVEPEIERINGLGVRAIPGDLISDSDLVRHDSVKLADAVFELVRDVRARNGHQGAVGRLVRPFPT